MADLQVITFGCRLNALESEVMRRRAVEAGLGRCRALQHLRGHRRSRPPGAAGDPAGAARQSGGDDHRLRLRGADRSESLCRHAGGRPRPRQCGEAGTRRVTSRQPREDVGADIRVDDIMAVRETAGHLVEGIDGRCRAFVEIQNGCDHRCTFCIIPFGRGPSRSVPMASVVEQIRSLVARRLPRGRADRRRHHRLWRRPAGAAEPSAGWCERSSATCRSSTGCGFPRSTRSRSTTTLLVADRRGGTADAASPSLAPARRRHDPEAHEAPPFARRRGRFRVEGAAPAAGRRLRRRPHRRLPDRDARRCSSSALSIVDELRAHPPPRLPVLAAPRNAGGADAAGRPRLSSRSAPRGSARKGAARPRRAPRRRSRARCARSSSSVAASAAPNISPASRSTSEFPARSSARGSPARPPAR